MEKKFIITIPGSGLEMAVRNCSSFRLVRYFVDFFFSFSLCR